MKSKIATNIQSRMTSVLQKAISAEIEKRRKLGHSIAIWKDGKVIVGKVESLTKQK
jgi:hypothetical protein